MSGDAQETTVAEVMRPFEQQTALERELRVHLWIANDTLSRGERALPRCVKRQEYAEAGQWQRRMLQAESDKEDFKHLLELYELERKENK
jgi:hypothetical protein